MDIETRLQQVATVINQIDDPKVPRNIRRQAKEACDSWLLNKAKKIDVRIAMAQSKLEELSSDVLESLVEKDRQQQEEAELMRAKKRARAKYIALDEEPAYVYKKGMRIQKLAAQVRSCLGFSLFRLFFA